MKYLLFAILLTGASVQARADGVIWTCYDDQKQSMFSWESAPGNLHPFGGRAAVTPIDYDSSTAILSGRITLTKQSQPGEPVFYIFLGTVGRDEYQVTVNSTPTWIVTADIVDLSANKFAHLNCSSDF